MPKWSIPSHEAAPWQLQQGCPMCMPKMELTWCVVITAELPMRSLHPCTVFVKDLRLQEASWPLYSEVPQVSLILSASVQNTFSSYHLVPL